MEPKDFRNCIQPPPQLEGNLTESRSLLMRPTLDRFLDNIPGSRSSWNGFLGTLYVRSSSVAAQRNRCTRFHRFRDCGPSSIDLGSISTSSPRRLNRSRYTVDFRDRWDPETTQTPSKTDAHRAESLLDVVPGTRRPITQSGIHPC